MHTVNKMACVALFHEVVSKATEDLVSSCGRTMIYSDFFFPLLPEEKGNLVFFSWEPSVGIKSRDMKSSGPASSGKHIMSSLS